MLNIFSSNPEKAGFRLQYMEILNWGALDKKIYSLRPQGENSLLTGANGSGKTTCVDALLTLLVAEKRKRFYNQSSGLQKKGDRTEESYVYGAYGDMAEEGKGTKTQTLRKDNAYSIILAHFATPDEQEVTLFQVRWFVGRDMKRVYGIAKLPLHIKENFLPFDGGREWLKRLKKIHNNGQKTRIEFFDGPSKYTQRLIKVFGMRSDKALEIFNKTVGIKVLDDLDEFIRTNMLEYKDTEAEFEKLEKSFRDLTDAQTNIQKTKEQIIQLKEIDRLAKTLEEDQTKLIELKNNEQTASFWFAEKGQLLTQEAIEQAILVQNQKAREKEENKVLIDKLKNDEADLRVQIKNDEIGQRIEQLKQAINDLEREKKHRKDKLDEYNTIATALQFPMNPDENTFKEFQKIALEKHETSQSQIQQINNEIFELERTEKQLKKDIEEKTDFIEYLLKNTNNVPERIAKIRDNILQATGADKREIPFIGELVKVKETEKTWEAAIEKVLHNFALRLIVPQKYYQEVNQYVNTTNLRGRIVYQRFQPQSSLHRMQNLPKNVLCNKLEFNAKSEYADWVEANIFNIYNYLCVNTLDEFETADKALTKEGLVKSKNRHEKDDRHSRNDRKNYVLGWDNKEKIKLLTKEVKKLQEEQKTNRASLNIKEDKRGNLKKQEQNLSMFSNVYTKFDEINWGKYASQIQEKKEERKQLEDANKVIQALEKQLEAVKGELKTADDTQEEIIGEITKIELKIEGLNKELKQHENTLKNIPEDFDTTKNYALLTENFPQLNKLNQDNFGEQLKNFDNTIQSNKPILNSKIQTNKSDLKRQIEKFIDPVESITSRFKDWAADASQLSDKIEFVGEFQQMLQRLEYDDLVKYESEFNNLLNEKLTHQVGSFNHFFGEWENQIKEDIAALNASLLEIDFDKSPQKSYIQLVAKLKFSENNKQFRQMLKDSIPNFAALNTDLEKKKEHFEQHIKPLINKLSTEEKWRKEVTDMRNRFEYYAEKYSRENDQNIRTYKDMGSLSGGQKPQLTYAILIAAVAYQFKLSKHGLDNKAFRFIVVDEAFTNQDSDKANFLMELCKQLHLQLLVVTPSDKIEIVEPYISRVHYIECPNGRESHLHDMPILQFKEKIEQNLTAQIATHD